MSLDPTDDNGEQFTFWLQKFEAYIVECNIVAAEDKFLKLKSRLSYSVYQHVIDGKIYVKGQRLQFGNMAKWLNVK